MALGQHLLSGLQSRGWQASTANLRENLDLEPGLLDAFDRADLVLISFPLYNDALPYHVIRAMQSIAGHRKTLADPQPRPFAVICNNGFPEAHQDFLALAICRQFARESGMQWAGGLAVGAAEALVEGQPLMGIQRPVPSVKHVLHALDLAAAALAAGQPIPERAVRRIAAVPIPLTPFWLWRAIFIRVAAKRWEAKASKNGLSKTQLFDRPLQSQLPAG